MQYVLHVVSACRIILHLRITCATTSVNAMGGGSERAVSAFTAHDATGMSPGQIDTFPSSIEVVELLDMSSSPNKTRKRIHLVARDEKRDQEYYAVPEMYMVWWQGASAIDETRRMGLAAITEKLCTIFLFIFCHRFLSPTSRQSYDRLVEWNCTLLIEPVLLCPWCREASLSKGNAHLSKVYLSIWIFVLQ